MVLVIDPEIVTVGPQTSNIVYNVRKSNSNDILPLQWCDNISFAMKHKHVRVPVESTDFRCTPSVEALMYKHWQETIALRINVSKNLDGTVIFICTQVQIKKLSSYLEKAPNDATPTPNQKEVVKYQYCDQHIHCNTYIYINT